MGKFFFRFFGRYKSGSCYAHTQENNQEFREKLKFWDFNQTWRLKAWRVANFEFEYRF